MGAIYLRHGDEFVAMHEHPYETEALLQVLLAEHPEILVDGEQGGDGHGWVLVKREAGVPDAEDAGGRWSLDHLFLDAAGVPTLVEVKRSIDTRARREVVAQMLDYAANATTFWKLESVQAWFEVECDRRGMDSAAALKDAFGVTEPAAFWERVRTNLAADRIRLVFVADEIAPELRSIVEFLNRQMSETEVLAIEVKQYVDSEGQRQTIVPRLVGRTEAARTAKRAAGRSGLDSYAVPSFKPTPRSAPGARFDNILIAKTSEAAEDFEALAAMLSESVDDPRFRDRIATMVRNGQIDPKLAPKPRSA